LKRVLQVLRRHKGRFALGIVAFIGLAGFVAYKQMSTSTPFTSEEAIERFRANEALSTPPDATGVAEAVPATSGAAPPPTAKPGAQSSEAGQPAKSCDWACPTTTNPPENGTYEYYQCGRTSGQCDGSQVEPAGTESASGLNRDLPRLGQRTIQSSSERSWLNRHFYSQEHLEEFDVSNDAGGVYNHRYKVDIRFGPIQGGSELKMQPPIRFASWPMSVGLSWKGAWTDTNREGDGDYECKVLSKEELKIGGQPAKTWLLDCHLRLKGPEVSGDVLLKFWLNPEQRNTSQEYYEQSLQTPQGPYSSKWMVTLANLSPKK
jgi:hypothetical protein